jgi:AbrB family looped-hinge helix DNA binding protein
MRITQKGQVTIPQDVRNRLGLLPYTEVEFEIADDHARIRKTARSKDANSRGVQAVRALRGTADTRMSTNEIMALTRGSLRRAPSSRGKR